MFMPDEPKANNWLDVKSFFSGPTANEDIEAGDQTNLLGKITSNFTNTLEVQTNYKAFFIVLGVGIIFLIFSLMSLPFVVLFPQKFLSLFSIGSVITLSSFIFIYGTAKYIKMLFEKSRLPYTIAYIVSIVLGVYFAFIKEYFLYSLICAVVQMITLVIFCLTFIPGGSTGITFILELLKKPIKKLFNKE
jgi:hypothetical protein